MEDWPRYWRRQQQPLPAARSAASTSENAFSRTSENASENASSTSELCAACSRVTLAPLCCRSSMIGRDGGHGGFWLLLFQAPA